MPGLQNGDGRTPHAGLRDARAELERQHFGIAYYPEERMRYLLLARAGREKRPTCLGPRFAGETSTLDGLLVRLARIRLEPLG